jgi:Leucine-rich repeat (LRR) protein
LNLKSLLLYKNRICNISNTKFPAALERISLYRNQIKAGDLDLSKNQVLTELNFGANPLESLTLSISGEVNSLKLRLRFVKGKVALKWRGQLGIEPAIITED